MTDHLFYTKEKGAYMTKLYFRKKIATYERNESSLDVIRIANKAIKAYPYEFEFYFERGKAWFIKGVDEQALSDFSKTLAIVPFYQAARIFRAALYRENNEYDKALSDVNTILEMSPKDAAALNERAKIEMLKGEYGKAIIDFSKAMEIEPDDENDEIYQERAEAYSKLGRLEEATFDSLKAQNIREKAKMVVPFQSTLENDGEEGDDNEVDEIKKLIIEASKPTRTRSRIPDEILIVLYYLCVMLIIVAGGLLLFRVSMWAVFAFAIIVGGLGGWFGSDLEWNLKARQKLKEDLEKQRSAYIIKGQWKERCILYAY
jgi:tetratricopeptide (TPR) repeat protein